MAPINLPGPDKPPPSPPAKPGDGSETVDVDKATESLAVVLIADRSMERLQEEWEDERKKDS